MHKRLLAIVLLTSFASTAGANVNERDAARVLRLLGRWQFVEARRAVDKIALAFPKARSTQYLEAEIAFFDGRYPAAVEHLASLNDDDFGGNVASLRTLATSSFEATRGFVAHKSRQGHFEFWYPPGKDQVLVDLAAETLEKAHAALGADLGVSPVGPIRVEILPTPRDLAKLSTLREADITTTGTIALCKYGKLMVVSPRATIHGYPWMDTLVHEYVHYLVSVASFDRVPVWLQEGLARYLQVRWRGSADGILSPVDEHLLATALRSNELIDFDAMHPSMAKLPSQQAAALAFAQVHTLLAFIHKRVGNAGLRAILAAHKKGLRSQKAVAATLNSTWEKLLAEWRNELRNAKYTGDPGLSGRALGPRIRFRNESVDASKNSDDNVGVDEVVSKRARKYARLGGLLLAHGRVSAAAVEYEKALKLSGTRDPFLVEKLSRTYLQQGRFAEALELAAPMVDVDDYDALLSSTAGDASLALGDVKKAAYFFEVSLAINPFDPNVRCGLAEAYKSLGDPRAQREDSACAALR